MLSVNTIIFEPSIHMLEFLKKSRFELDGDFDCLPRRSISELRYALRFMMPNVFIVRASELHRCDELRGVVFDLHAQSVEIVIVQDTEPKFKGSTTSFGNLHYVSNVGEVGELRRLMVLAQLKAISRQPQSSTLR